MSFLLNINHFINFLIVFLLTGCVIKRQVVIEIPDSHMFWIQNSKTEPSKIQRATLFWTNDAVLFTFNHHKLSFRSLTAIIRIISANIKNIRPDPVRVKGAVIFIHGLIITIKMDFSLLPLAICGIYRVRKFGSERMERKIPNKKAPLGAFNALCGIF